MPDISTVTLRTILPVHVQTGTRRFLRALVFLYVIIVACPIRYWAIASDIDNTWVFALNYAAAHGLAHGRDIVWNTGPLGHFVFPQDVGSNLSQALIFQTALWVVLIAVFADLFFRSNIRLRNLIPFAVLFGLSAPLFWFNRVGLDNLLLVASLVLLIVHRWRGGMLRYLAALILLGLTPGIKPTAALVGAGALSGFLVDRSIALRSSAWRYIGLAAVIPAGIAGVVWWLTVPSLEAFGVYLQATMDTSAAYSVAMSHVGSGMELLVVLEIIFVIAALLTLEALDSPKGAAFLGLLLAIPMFISFKHGFVRQDVHVVNFFCFACVAASLFFLQSEATGRRWSMRLLLVLPLGILWQDYVTPHLNNRASLMELTGLRAAPLAWQALFGGTSLHNLLRADSEISFPDGAGLEPEIRAVIGNFPVASLSVVFAGAAMDDLDIRIYPVVQRMGAITPYLDGLNAAWFRDRGPRFLIFDGNAIDGRQPWAETPQTWLEIYRWYDTRLLGSRNLLLERRQQARFQRLVRVDGFPLLWTSRLALPPSQTAGFWSIQCELSVAGQLRKTLFRISQVTIEAERNSQARGKYRVIMDLLRTPVMGNFLPTTLDEFAELFRGGVPTYSVDALNFGGAALRWYSSPCQVELWQVAS